MPQTKESEHRLHNRDVEPSELLEMLEENFREKTGVSFKLDGQQLLCVTNAQSLPEKISLFETVQGAIDQHAALSSN